MEFLRWLERLRTPIGDTFFSAVTLLGEETLFIVAGLLFFWCINKRQGYFLLFVGFLGTVFNQFLKLLFRIPRPWVRDPSLTVVGDAKTAATGYSFPSGHTMLATGFYGGLAVWQKKRGWFAGLCVFLTLLTAFSRNWLGAHTLEDVLVGILSSCAVIAVNMFLLRWTDKQKRNERIIFVASMALFAALCLLYPTSLKTAGIYGGVMLGWFIERRFIGFEVKGSVLFRTGTFLVGILIVGVLYKIILPQLFAALDSNLSDMFSYFVVFLVIMAGWPCIIKLALKRFKEKVNL